MRRATGLPGAAAALLLLLTAWPEAALAAMPPAPEAPLPDPAAVLAPHLIVIEKARAGAVPQPERVADALKQGLAALDQAEAASREALKRVEAAIEKEPRSGPTKTQAADRLRLRTHQAQVALARGDLYRLAAAAVPKDCADRTGWLQQAVQVFGALRVEYRDLVLGFMGYIGEARAQRTAGNLEAASAALKPVLALPVDPKDPTSQDLRRMAGLEVLETQLATDPRKALADAHAAAESVLFKNVSPWQGRLDWLIARAEAADLTAFGGSAGPGPSAGRPDAAKDRPARAAALLRREGTVQAAPYYDRLALLAQLDRLAGGGLVTPQEAAQWADALALTGRPEAVRWYERARAAGPLAVDQAVVYISLIFKQDRFADVAEACDDLLKRIEAAHPQRNTVLQWRAAALWKQLASARPAAPQTLRDRTLAALAAVFDGALEPAVRRDALRQWVALRGRDGLGACAETLAAHPDLVSGDPYLAYSLAAGQWERLAADLAAGNVTEPVAMVQARALAENLSAAQAEAAGPAPSGGGPPLPAGAPVAADLVARAALVRAQILAAEPLRDSRAALTVLNEQWKTLAADAATVEPAGWLRVELMVDLGLVDAASVALAELPDGAAPKSPMSLLRLADALAGRASGMTADALADARREVLRFCDRAMSLSLSNPQTFRIVSQRSAKAMLQVGAYADAERVLARLLESEDVKKDPALALENALVMAEVRQRQGRPEEALKLLEPLAAGPAPSGGAPAASAGIPHDAVAVHLAISRCRTALGQPQEALAAARQARAIARPGSEDWCLATLAVAEGLTACGHLAAATDILRVSDALYPEFGTPECRRKMRRMREDLEGKMGSRPAATAGAQEKPS